MSGDYRQLAERLKDVAYDEGIASMRATVRTGNDTWTTVTVREAGLMDNAADGWAIEIENGGL